MKRAPVEWGSASGPLGALLPRDRGKKATLNLASARLGSFGSWRYFLADELSRRRRSRVKAASKSTAGLWWGGWPSNVGCKERGIIELLRKRAMTYDDSY